MKYHLKNTQSSQLLSNTCLIYRHYVTFLEILIAMTLTALILMTLTFFYQQVVVIGSDIDRIKSEQFHIRYVENRFAEIIPKIISNKDKSKNFTFFSTGDEGISYPGSQGLIFSYDNGISLDKPFSNHVVGRLLLDQNGRLMLFYWPIPKSWDDSAGPLPVKKEILMENVTSLAFEFFVAPVKAALTISSQVTSTSDNADKKTTPATKAPEEKETETEKKTEEPQLQTPEPQGAWRRQPWLKEFNQLPLMVKIIITTKKEPQKNEGQQVFIFPLANIDRHIIYD